MFYKFIFILMIIIIITIAMIDIDARPPNRMKIPNGMVFGCQTCHIKPTGGAPWNQFGLDFKANDQKWDLTLGKKDSDGDGWTNAEELGDPECMWREGMPDPAPENGVFNPGDATSHPEPSPANSSSWGSLKTLVF